MAFGIFRSDFLPYCIKQIKKGHFVILNREYKPLGQRTSDRVDYRDHMVKIPGLTPQFAAKLSVHGDSDRSAIYLYNDDCIPERLPRHMASYVGRLALLARLAVEDADVPGMSDLHLSPSSV